MLNECGTAADRRSEWKILFGSRPVEHWMDFRKDMPLFFDSRTRPRPVSVEVSICKEPPMHIILHNNARLVIRYPPDIRPRPLPGLIFSNIRPRSVTNWISTCGVNWCATCSLRSAECHRVKPTANLVCVISEVTGAQLVTAAQHTLWRVGSL